jgi:hypothetical protein
MEVPIHKRATHNKLIAIFSLSKSFSLILVIHPTDASKTRQEIPKKNTRISNLPCIKKSLANDAPRIKEAIKVAKTSTRSSLVIGLKNISYYDDTSLATIQQELAKWAMLKFHFKTIKILGLYAVFFFPVNYSNLDSNDFQKKETKSKVQKKKKKKLTHAPKKAKVEVIAKPEVIPVKEPKKETQFWPQIGIISVLIGLLVIILRLKKTR